MTHNNPTETRPYDGLHAIVVDALRYDLSGATLDHAAHEVLQRLRDTGLDIPANPSA
jgi:hypothetical protein